MIDLIIQSFPPQMIRLISNCSIHQSTFKLEIRVRYISLNTTIHPEKKGKTLQSLIKINKHYQINLKNKN